MDCVTRAILVVLFGRATLSRRNVAACDRAVGRCDFLAQANQTTDSDDNLQLV